MNSTDSQAHHTSLPIENVLLSSYTDSTPTLGEQKIPLLVHYLAVDHDAKAVILYVDEVQGYQADCQGLSRHFRPF